jgi:hypothetical protein
LGTTAKEAVQSPGGDIQTDDGAEWLHGVDLMKGTSLCHRRTASRAEFAVAECLPFKMAGTNAVLNSRYNAKEVLQTFARDQRQVLRLWQGDVTAKVRERVAEKYPRQDMSIVVESFESTLAHAISQTHVNAQSRSQSRGGRI